MGGFSSEEKEKQVFSSLTQNWKVFIMRGVKTMTTSSSITGFPLSGDSIHVAIIAKKGIKRRA